jgi:uncharacterized protein
MIANPPARQHICSIPCPAGPWQWRQRWSDLLFMHWPVPKDLIQKHIPVGLDLDTWNERTWATLVAFRLERTRQRRLEFLSLADNFIELNLRTYVLYQGEPAIYFLSIRADKRLAVALAKWLTPLPYVQAPMTFDRKGASYRLQCRDGHELDVDFKPCSEAKPALHGSLTEWLLERYGLYATSPHGTLLRTVVQHCSWRTQDVTLRLRQNTIGAPFGLPLAGAPKLAHFSPRIEALIWPFAKPK